MSPPLPTGMQPGGRFADWSPQRPRYVVADVDGTLVGPSSAASPGVAAAIDAAQQAGIRVGFATGRMRLAVEALWEQIHASGPHVLHNGAEVRADGHTVASWPLTSTHVTAVLGLCRDRDLYAEIYLPDAYLVTREDPRAQPHWELLGRDPAGVVTDAGQLTGDVLKATFALFDVGEDEVAAVAEAIVAAGMLAGPATSPRTPEIDYVNATSPEADKGRALTHAAASIGIDLAAVAAIGDAPNDLSMLAIAGTAVAMGQAPQRVRDAAHLVVPNVDDDGVATLLGVCTGWAADAGADGGSPTWDAFVSV